MKERALSLMYWVGDHWIITIMSAIVWLVVLWTVGYICNAVYGTKFEIASCWQGVAVVCGAGVVALGKYYTASKYNSDGGSEPTLVATTVLATTVSSAEGEVICK